MRGLEKNCTRWRKQTSPQTDISTDGHGDSMTNLAQWGRVGENHNSTQADTLVMFVKDAGTQAEQTGKTVTDHLSPGIR